MTPVKLLPLINPCQSVKHARLYAYMQCMKQNNYLHNNNNFENIVNGTCAFDIKLGCI